MIFWVLQLPLSTVAVDVATVPYVEDDHGAGGGVDIVKYPEVARPNATLAVASDELLGSLGLRRLAELLDSSNDPFSLRGAKIVECPNGTRTELDAVRHRLR